MLIKICCIKTEEELATVIDEGVECVGLVSAMPSGIGIISDEQIKKLSAFAPKFVNTFLLTSRTNPTDIIDQWRWYR